MIKQSTRVGRGGMAASGAGSRPRRLWKGAPATLIARHAALFLITASLFASGCGQADGPGLDETPDEVPERQAQTQEPPPLECEEKGYPCTWAEVPESVDQRSRAVVHQALDRLYRGDSLLEVAVAVHDTPDVEEVMMGESTVRVRVEGGRPEWIYLPADSLTIGGPPAISLSPAPASLAPDPVGGEDMAKKALILSAFKWQWEIHGTSDDVDSIATLLRNTRDYEKGSVEIRQNTLNSTTVAPTIDYQVTVNDFTGWNDYDVVHLSTHGGTVCRVLEATTPGAIPEVVDGPCQTSLSTGERWTGNEALGGTDLSYTTVEGIGRTWVAIVADDAQEVSAAAGVPLPPASNPLPRYWGAGPFVTVETEFFIRAYPQGLSESLVVLNACQSGKENSLISHLSGGGSTVMGWTRTMGLNEATEAGLCFWQTMLGHIDDTPDILDRCQVSIYNLFEGSGELPFEGGATVEDAILVLHHGDFSATSAATVAQDGAIVISSGDAEMQVTAESSLFSSDGSKRNRAIEIIRLLDADADTELADSGFVAISGSSGDGVPDTLLAELEVFGIGPSDEPDQMTLYLDVDGARQSASYELVSFPARDRGRTIAELPLDVDLEPGGTIDVEAWLEFADGKSHWLYEDLRYDFVWRAAVGPGPYAGTYVGSEAEAWWGPGGLQSLSLAGVNAGPAPYVYVTFYVEGLGYADPGTYTPPLGMVEMNFSQTPAVFDPGAQLYYLNHGGSASSTAPWTSTLPPDPVSSTPISLVFTELSEDRVRGYASGTFFHFAEPVEPGYHHPAIGVQATGSVRIDFDVVPCTRERARAGTGGC